MPQNLSIGPLSMQWATRDIRCVIPASFSIWWKVRFVYWKPRSLWNRGCASGLANYATAVCLEFWIFRRFSAGCISPLGKLPLLAVWLVRNIYDFRCFSLGQNCPHFGTLTANLESLLCLHLTVWLLLSAIVYRFLSLLLSFAWVQVIFFLFSYKNAPYIAFSVLFHCSLYREHITFLKGLIVYKFCWKNRS